MRCAGAFTLVLVAVLMLLEPSALAQPAPVIPTPPPASSPEADDSGEMVGVEQGQPAPFAGILLTEAAFTRAAGLQLALDDASGKLHNRDVALGEAAARQATLENELSDARSSGSPPCEGGGWWGRNSFLVGTLVGVAATVTATVLLWNAVDSGGGV